MSILSLICLLSSTNAYAASAQFRYSHNEPLNDLSVTPGAIFNVTAATICRPGYSSSVRDVPESEKEAVYAEYGITNHTTNQYEIDHLISLELGGNNSLANLWPELNDHPRGYLNSKDILENYLHSRVCAGSLSLASAQNQIATNWVLAYHAYLGSWPIGISSPPTSTTSSTPATTSTTVLAPTTSSSVTTTTNGISTTTTPPSLGVNITSLIASVAPGGHEVLSAHSIKPSDSCTLVVVLPSGRQSTESGLGTLITDANGNGTWAWLIGPTTGAGVAHVSVTCSAGVAYGTFSIT